MEQEPGTQLITEAEYEQILGDLETYNASLPVMSRIPKAKFNKESILAAFSEAFLLIGGVPRLALWAHENPSKFFGHMARMASGNAGVNINSSGPLVIRPTLPPSSLDGD